MREYDKWFQELSEQEYSDPRILRANIEAKNENP